LLDRPSDSVTSGLAFVAAVARLWSGRSPRVEPDTFMAAPLKPVDEAELAAAVREAATRKTPLAVEGGGTRRGLGRPMQTAATLSTAKLRGVTLYEPTELVISARAGTPLSEVEATLAKYGQRLAFEPMDHRYLERTEGEPTIGGVVAANVSGPRRIEAGAARDTLIGVRAVTGRGEAVKSGGRVMKNVTGYDLVKFLAGSYGTLAVLSEVTFKVLPKPETEATLVLPGLDERKAVAALSRALGSPYGVSGAAHLPALGARWSETLLRIEGFADSVAHRMGRLAAELSEFGRSETMDVDDSVRMWRRVRDAAALGGADNAPIWRISAKPSDAPFVAEHVRRAFQCTVLYDWGGGLLWIAGGEGTDAGAAVVRAAVAAVGGHATLVRASDDVRLAVPVFEPQPAPVMALSRRLKEAFDPEGILNPGRMYAGL
jgi:glycolate oxidase FAD binding subunit